ncbi:T9SS type B sorting domain-containing protein, partial [Pontimicrobium sp. MEBiC06410]
LEDNYLLCINTNGTEVINTPAIDTGLTVADGYTFTWYLEGVEQPQYTNQSSITPTEGGNYSVVVTSALGCSTIVGDPNTVTFVEVSEPPVVTAEITTLAFADQHDIAVTATTTASTAISVYEFSIDGGAWEANTPNDGMYTFSNVEAGEHTITVRDAIGCGETTITITVIDYPHYFTPNGDGYHDTWNIYGLAGQADAIIYIFDRYGKLLKQLSPSGSGWNGTYNGNPMPNSTYWFTVQYREPSTNEVKTFKAHFALKR